LSRADLGLDFGPRGQKMTKINCRHFWYRLRYLATIINWYKKEAREVYVGRATVTLGMRKATFHKIYYKPTYVVSKFDTNYKN
jgi:hypothetical protein